MATAWPIGLSLKLWARQPMANRRFGYEELVIISLCHPSLNTALALFAPWCDYTTSTFADSSTLGGKPRLIQ